MGDYTKLIVHCEVRGVDEKTLHEEIDELGLLESAYHCDGLVEQVTPKSPEYEEAYICLTLIGQTKYGRGQDEFLEWLSPYVIQGSGEDDVWAIQFTEYTAAPALWKMTAAKGGTDE